MTATASERTLETIRRLARPGGGVGAALDAIGERRVVLLGEATHGTAEFYRIRGEITRRLIEERGFAAVALEADFPDAARAGRYAKGEGSDPDANAALLSFDRFPLWMWRNRAFAETLEALRAVNAPRRPRERAGVFGLDLYSLHRSADAVIEYLDRTDPAAAARARARYACLDVGPRPHDDGQAYGHAASLGARPACDDEVLRQLLDLRERAAERVRRDGLGAEDEAFLAERNAEVVRGAEAYYRAMFNEHRGGESTWNLRDRHMSETLAAIERHLAATGRPRKIVVWAHNSHIGDARATSMGWGGELNLGQLTRERLGGECFLLGFTTHTGTVTCGRDWGDDPLLDRVRPSRPDSVEHLFHLAAGEGSPARGGLDGPPGAAGSFLLDLRRPEAAEALAEPRLQRMIGVVYRPETERLSHYAECDVARQFDAVIHVDRTHAVEPLDPVASWNSDLVAETYPSGL